ncbi:choice-of-anchor K domain-containing protein, partial [Shewanella sp. YIC-542]|uniref:choice-of-anchor K domain-containing protein n=1 Tax=Shewanella mytili TaxID=3377111 RepID=UPI00398EA8A5
TVDAPTDDVYLDGETLTVSITNAQGGNYEKLDTSDTASTLVNDTTDTVFAQISVDKSSVTEGGEITYTVTVTLVDASGNSVTLPSGASVSVSLDWSGSASAADVDTLPPSVTISGDSQQSFTVNTINDGIYENSENLNVTISGVTDVDNSLEQLEISANNSASTTILDAQDAPIVTSIIGDTVVEGAANTFTVNLSNTASSDTTQTLTLAGNTATKGVDFSDTEVTVTINGTAQTVSVNADGTFAVTVPANTDSFTVKVNTTDDTIFESTEDYTLSGTGANGTVTGTAQITDNDILGGDSINLSLQDADTAGDNHDTDSSSLTFTASDAADIISFSFGPTSGITVNGLDGNITWLVDSNSGNLVGSIDGTPMIILSLNSDSAVIGSGQTGSVSVTATLLDNLQHESVPVDIDSINITGIVINAVDSLNNSASGTVNLTVADDEVVLNAASLDGINAPDTYTGTLDTSGVDQPYSADLSANVSGWDGVDTTFADSGITSNGLDILYYVDPNTPNVLIAYTDTNDTTSAYQEGTAGQEIVFTLTANPNDDSYAINIQQSIDSLSNVAVAGLQGGKGGNDAAIYVGYDAADGTYEINSNLSALTKELAFTLTSHDVNGDPSTINGNTGGFGSHNAFIDADEIFVVDYAQDVASASFNFTGADTIYFKAYAEDGTLLGEGVLSTEHNEISNLGPISYVELTTDTDNDNFQFTGSTAATIVSTTEDVTLNFDVAVSDSDGDITTDNFDVHLAAPDVTTVAPTAENATLVLQEADLVENVSDAAIKPLSFHAGSDALRVFQFGDTDNIHIEGIKANATWALNEDGQLVGTVMGREAIRLTLDWDQVNAGETGNIEVKAELLTTLPHSVDSDNLTITGIEVIGVTGAGQTATSNVTVTVADDNNQAIDDGNTVNVIVDSFQVSGVEATWTHHSGGTYVGTHDGADNDTAHDQIRWGQSTRHNGQQSGYGFADNDASLSGHLALNEEIVLGTFTHYNYPIYSGGGITSASMDVTFNVTDAYGQTTPVTLTVDFDHNETPNNYNNTAADIVTVGQSHVTFVYEGDVYTLQVIGFKDPVTGDVVTQIHTAENAETSYELVVRVVAGDGYELPSTTGNVLNNDIVGADDIIDLIGVKAGDHKADADGVNGNINVEIAGQYGTLVLHADGTYNYHVTVDGHNIPDNAVDTFTYTVKDGDGDISSALLNINVNTTNYNDIHAIADANSALEDTPISGNVLDNDGKNNTSVASFIIAGADTVHNAAETVTLNEGKFTLNTDGSYTFTPTDDWNGTVPKIIYTTNTGADAALELSITPVDDASTLVADTKTANEDHAATGNVLSNDSDIDSTLQVSQFTVNGHTYSAGSNASLDDGVLTINADGSYQFTPNSNWSGTVPEVTYTTNTGSSDTLNITINPVADTPLVSVDNFTSVAAINFEDAAFNGAWGGVVANNIQGLNTIGTWHTSNHSGAIEVGYEHIYLGGQNNGNKVMEIEYNKGDKTLYTDMSLEAGRFYELGFDIAFRTTSLSATSGLTVKLIPLDSNGHPVMADAITLYNFDQSASGWLLDQKVTLPIDESGNYRLLFEGDNGDSFGAILDNLAFRALDNYGYEGDFIKLGNINAALVDNDSSESLTLSMQGLPEGAVLKDGAGHEATVGADGSVDITDWNHDGLQVKVASSGDFTVTVNATATEDGNQSEAHNSTSFVLTVLDNTNDLLVAGEGIDTFIWKAGDTGTDHVTNFALNEDKLDISDLLTNWDGDNNTLDDYLSVSMDNGNTVIDIDMNTDGQVDQSIILDGTDVSDYGHNSSDIIQGLIDSGNGPLIVQSDASDSGATSTSVDPLRMDHVHQEG